MRIFHTAAWVVAVALVATPLAHSAPDASRAASAEAGWTNGFDLAGGADGGPLSVVGAWTSGYDLPSDGDRSVLLVVEGWTNGYDLQGGNDEILNVAFKPK